MSYYKVLADNLKHHNYTYKLGLNELPDEWNPTGECSVGGFYICEFQDIYRYLKYGNKIGIISLPSDTQIYKEKHKIKVNKLVLERIISFADWNWRKICKLNGLAIRYIPEYLLTDKLCYLACKSDPNAIEFIPNEFITKKICEIVCKKNARLFEFIPDELITKELCDLVCRTDAMMLGFIPHEFKTKELCDLACQSNATALGFVPDKFKTKELCDLAYKKTDEVLQYIPRELQNEEQRDKAMKLSLIVAQLRQIKSSDITYIKPLGVLNPKGDS